MKLTPALAIVLSLGLLSLSACRESGAEQHHEEHHKILVTSPMLKDVVSTQQYVCQIHSRRHIEVRALETGYLEEIPVKEGQAVKQGDLMFKLVSTLYQAKLDSEAAEAQQAQIEYDNTKKLFEQNVVSQQELKLAQAKLAKAQAQVKLAQAELNFTEIKAPFDGIIDRLQNQHGSLIAEGDILTTMSDNSVMWVYFNVPEARYLEYKTGLNKYEADLKVELVLADGKTFEHAGKIGAIEADFNNETGNIAFRADFPNPEGLLRHGQTGTVLISRVIKDAIVIPQRATFEILAKKYAYVVEEPGGDHPETTDTKKGPAHDDEDDGDEDDGDEDDGDEEDGDEEDGDRDDDDGDDDEDDGDREDDEDDENDDDDHEKEQSAKHKAEPTTKHGATHAGKTDAAHAGKHGAAHGLKQGVVRQRDIVIDNTLDDIYLIQSGLSVKDKIILEGIGQVRDGETVEYEFRKPEEVLRNLKYKAE